nr:hypothetical protein B0A51_01714 [Rachicladosporium sp. CCFEE 5018]
MYRHQNDSHPSSQTLRQRRKAHSTEFGSSSPGHVRESLPWKQTLDLSICQPAPQSPNRFAILATLDQPTTKTREFHTSSTRRARVSKDARKRRDLKRSKRRLDAHKLDTQLGREINEMLNVTEIHLTTDLDDISPTEIEQAPPQAVEDLSPPALPVPQFSAFDLSSFPHLLASLPEPIAVPPAVTLPDLPLRRSRTWSITKDEAWRDCLPAIIPSPARPSVHGLDAQTQVCKELQIYAPRAKSAATKHSRFFPPANLLTAAEQGLSPPRRARTKLPRVACQLHATDNGSEDIVRSAKRAPTPFAVTEIIERSRTPETPHSTKVDQVLEAAVAAGTSESTTPSAESLSQGSDDTLLRKLEHPAFIWHMITAATTFDESKLIRTPDGKHRELSISTSVSQPIGQEQVTSTVTQTDDTCGPCFCDEATAANLWNILSSVPSIRPANDLEDAFLASTIPLPAQTASKIEDLNHLILSRDHLCASPFELVGSVVPYTHPNSLTGYSNTRSQTPCVDSLTALPTYYDTGLPILTIAYDEPPAYSPELTGMNELMVDTEYLAHTSELPTTTRSEIYFSATPLRTPVPRSSFHTCQWWDDVKQSLEHISPTEVVSVREDRPRAASPTEIADSVLADLFTQGHAKNCNCGYCDPDPLPFVPSLSGSITDSACCMLYPLGSDADTETLTTRSDTWEDEDNDFNSIATEDGDTESEIMLEDDEDWTWATASEVYSDSMPILVTSYDEPDCDEVDEDRHFMPCHGWNALFNDTAGKCAAHAEADDWTDEDGEDEEQWESAWDVEDAGGWDWAF